MRRRWRVSFVMPSMCPSQRRAGGIRLAVQVSTRETLQERRWAPSPNSRALLNGAQTAQIRARTPLGDHALDDDLRLLRRSHCNFLRWRDRRWLRTWEAGAAVR